MEKITNCSDKRSFLQSSLSNNWYRHKIDGEKPRINPTDMICNDERCCDFEVFVILLFDDVVSHSNGNICIVFFEPDGESSTDFAEVIGQ